jgi:hypothetical protein
MSGRTAILLTATVDPGVYAQQSGRPSAQDRYNDYVSAIRFYASLSDDRIVSVVLCENSNHNFRDLVDLLNTQSNQTEFEILNFIGNSKTAGTHYGYSELGIIDHAIEQSQLLKKCDSFLKISGRLMLSNIIDLLSFIPNDTDFAVDLRRAYLREGGHRYRARTQIMYSSLRFYEDVFFKKRYKMIGVCTHIEEFIPISISSVSHEYKMMLRFPIECAIVGVSGSNNTSYSSSRNRIKRTVRGLVRKNFPQLWL